MRPCISVYFILGLSYQKCSPNDSFNLFVTLIIELEIMFKIVGIFMEMIIPQRVKYNFSLLLKFEFDKMGCQYSFLSVLPDQFTPSTKQFQPKLTQVQALISKGNFKDAQKIGHDLFIKNKLEYASAIYRLIIQNNPSIDYSFQALGNSQLANGLYQWNIPKWYLQTGKIHGQRSPYDALSLCNCQLQAYEKTLFCQQSIKWYRKQMQRKQDPRLMVGLANLLQAKQKSEAIQLYTKAVGLMPDKVNLHLSLAFTYFQSGNKMKAVEYAEKAAKLSPKNGYSEFLIAMTEENIESRIQKLISIRNKHVQQRCLKQVSILYSQQRHDPNQALNYLGESIRLLKKKGFEDFELNMRQIGLYLQLSNYEVYLQLAAEQIAIKHDYNPVREQSKELLINNLIDSLCKSTLAAKEILANIAFHLDSKHECFSRYIHFAKLFFEKKVFALGIECMKQSVKNISLIEEAQLLTTIYKGLITKYKSNSQHLASFLPIVYSQLFDFASLSIQSFKQGWRTAIECYLLAIEVQPNCAKSHYNIGEIYRSDHSYHQALEYFDKTLQIDPNFTLAQAQKALCYLQTGDEQLGMKSFRKITDQMEKGQSNLDDHQRQCLMRMTDQFSHQIDGLSKKKSTMVSKLSASDKQIFQRR